VLVPLPLRRVHRIHKVIVFQQLIDGAHPGFPQLGHFLGEKRLPETRLLMSQSNHDGMTLQNRIRLFCSESNPVTADPSERPWRYSAP